MMIIKNRKINILDTTLRDGSYAVNFSFTAADTAIICEQLERVGIEYIEIGHGVGLNATNKGYGNAAQTDEEYLRAAQSILKKAKYGMFCIPGIARLEDIDNAADCGMGFVRIGTNVTEVEHSKEFIRKAKNRGLFVPVNYMKSYALTPEKFAQKVKLSVEYGADMIYVVDSAGGMFREDIKQYYDAIREVTDLPVGFHGHNNLGMALANSVEAINMGYDFVDTSLQGLGRSSGNAATELLVTVLKKYGYDINSDFINLLKIGQKYIQPLISTRGFMPLDIISGYADFHSSYMHHIQKYSGKYLIDPILLVLEWCKFDKIDVNEEKMEQLAQQIKKDEDFYLGKYGFERYVGKEQE